MIGYKRVTTEEELRRKDLFFWSAAWLQDQSHPTVAGAPPCLLRVRFGNTGVSSLLAVEEKGGSAELRR